MIEARLDGGTKVAPDPAENTPGEVIAIEKRGVAVAEAYHGRGPSGVILFAGIEFLSEKAQAAHGQEVTDDLLLGMAEAAAARGYRYLDVELDDPLMVNTLRRLGGNCIELLAYNGAADDYQSLGVDLIDVQSAIGGAATGLSQEYNPILARIAIQD